MNYAALSLDELETRCAMGDKDAQRYVGEHLRDLLDHERDQMFDGELDMGEDLRGEAMADLQEEYALRFSEKLRELRIPQSWGAAQIATARELVDELWKVLQLPEDDNAKGR